VLWYHNVTPGDLRRPFNPGVAALCDQARRALTQLDGRFDTLVADSSFNAADLRMAGLGTAAVVPLLLDVGRHERSQAGRAGGPVILSVGRIAPHKRLEDVVKVFALYQKYREPTASLVLVGSDDSFEDYRTAVERLAERVGAEQVRFTGRIPAAERDRWYAQASAYLCMSVHEGFCAPLIEALTHGVPVVARKAGAVPETLAGAGLVIDGEDLPLFAEALHEVVSSPTTRTVLAGAAERRLAELRPEVVEARGREALRPVLVS
jgi:glycosyltransferase involved in cell wall biosynthesis